MLHEDATVCETTETLCHLETYLLRLLISAVQQHHGDDDEEEDCEDGQDNPDDGSGSKLWARGSSCPTEKTNNNSETRTFFL